MKPQDVGILDILKLPAGAWTHIEDVFVGYKGDFSSRLYMLDKPRQEPSHGKPQVIIFEHARTPRITALRLSTPGWSSPQIMDVTGVEL